METESGKSLKEKLCRKTVVAEDFLSDEEKKEVFDYCEGYKKFLGQCKTERECVKWIVPLLEKMGFTPIEDNKQYKPGDRVYFNNRDKALICAVMGKRPISDGVRLAASHIDSPCIDLKPNPLYEDCGFGFFKTHYYGGIKKYQFTTTPMALHGVVVKSDGSKVNIVVGEEDDDPVFCFTDLLIHLSEELEKRTMKDGIKGEELNLLIGSTPYADKEISERIKLNLLKILNDKYGITEPDFETADLTIVPAVKPRDLGLDRSMIGAYAHDDKVCTYGTLMGLLHADPEYTAVACFADKEETGSNTPTGMGSRMIPNFISRLSDPYGVPENRVISKSCCLSADVSVAHDPTFGDATEKNNTPYMNRGVVIHKYTGARGKVGTNDATAEYFGKIRKMFDDSKVQWQTGELGRVDLGGGGTVAKHISLLDIDTIDCGVPVISMHSPFEVVSKSDTYMMYKAAMAFFNDK